MVFPKEVIHIAIVHNFVSEGRVHRTCVCVCCLFVVVSRILGDSATESCKGIVKEKEAYLQETQRR